MLYTDRKSRTKPHAHTRMTGARRAISSCDCASLDSTRTTLSTFSSCKQEEPRTGSSNSTLSADASGGHERVSRELLQDCLAGDCLLKGATAICRCDCNLLGHQAVHGLGLDLLGQLRKRRRASVAKKQQTVSRESKRSDNDSEAERVLRCLASWLP